MKPGSAPNRLPPHGIPRRLVVLTRYPEPGKTKTRLIGALGAEGAADLQRRMAEFVLACARRFSDSSGVDLEVRYDGGSRQRMTALYGPLAYAPQGKGDVGERMARAFRDGFAAGFERVVLVGTDCPWISERILRDAFDGLSRFDAVFGPAFDGGYYLVGLRRFEERLFDGILWGTDRVLAQSLTAALSAGVSFALVDELRDVDREEDLPAWRAFLEGMGVASISVIVPTLNEEEHIAGALDLPLSEEHEVIVADGGSTDRTVEVARALGAKTLVVVGGRARQLNAAASKASGDILLFLHADTRLPAGFDDEVRRLAAVDGAVGGAFRFKVDERLAGVGLIERLTDLRSRRQGLPYGDQAIFVKAEVFRAMGGFRDMPIMEDYEFVRRLRRRGRIVISDLPVVTSARRWRKLGVLRTTLVNQVMIAGYHAGVSAKRLARWYRRTR